VIAGACYAFAEGGKALLLTGPAGAFWPAGGLAIAVLYLGGLRWWPGVLLGDLGSLLDDVLSLGVPKRAGRRDRRLSVLPRGNPKCRQARRRRRHGHGRLQREGDHLEFGVHDTGRGFDPWVTARGAGLTGLKDRIETVGGRVEIVASPGRGTTVAGVVPWPRRRV
jgi:hypothetical protein